MLTKKQRIRNSAIALMQSHYRATGLNLYFRNAIYRVLNENIEDAVRSLEQDGSVTRVNVKGAIAYQLKDELLK
jgi:hypothetical protein